jgi:hypothetical protein
MHFDDTTTFDVVERIRLVTGEALLDPRPFLVRHDSVHHFEVHHIMTWGRPVALGAVGGFWTRMKEAIYSPRRRNVTTGALFAKESLVLVLGQMASLAIKRAGMASRLVCHGY